MPKEISDKNKFAGNILSVIEFLFNPCYNFCVGKNPKNFANAMPRVVAMYAICAAFFCAAFSSCKKKSQRALEESTELSRKIHAARENAVWAYEIEGTLLSKRISSVDAIDKSISLEPLALIALEGGKSFPAVFAEIEGFTSLDTSDIQGSVLDTVNGFCRAFAEYVSASQEVIPETSAAQEAGESGVPSEEKDSSKIDSFFPEATLYSLVLFLADSKDLGNVESFVIGRAFIEDETIEVPIRFSCENGVAYALAYPAPYEESWKIQQIEIYKLEEKNGKPHGN